MTDTLAWLVVGATLLPAHRVALAASRTQLAALLALDVIAVAMILVASSSSGTWSTIAQEDGSIEWATAAAFVMAAVCLVVFVRRIAPSRWFKGACLLLALFCLAVAGEELSWGQRLFGFKPPAVFLERNFQQEMNLHNVLMHEGGLGFKLESKHLVMAIALGFCLVWPALVQRPRFRVFGPLAPPFALAPIALGVVAMELSYPVDLTGEGAELMTSLLFLASAVIAVEARPGRVVAWMVAPLILGTLISIAMSRIVFGSDEDGTRAAQAELAQLQADVLAGARPRLAGKTIHKRLFTTTRDGYLHLAGGAFLEGRGTAAEPNGPTPRDDRHGYFLDPWNNPYWIHHDKKTRTAQLYSFGPNRRRDLEIRKLTSDAGDDIVVRFALPSSTSTVPATSSDEPASQEPSEPADGVSR